MIRASEPKDKPGGDRQSELPNVEEALDGLRAVVREAGQYVEGSAAQAAYLRVVLPEVAAVLFGALDIRYPDAWGTLIDDAAVERAKNIIDGLPVGEELR